MITFPRGAWERVRGGLLVAAVLLAGVFVWPAIQPSAAQQKKYQTLGYRSCGTERGTCHQSDGNWWKADPHFSSLANLKRKKQKSMRIAQGYGLEPSDYLKANSPCAACHGEAVSGREANNLNTGVSCESCHGPAGPKGVGYFEIHQEGTPPSDPLSTERTGYQKALRVGLRELRNVNTRAQTCVDCHQINEKKLLEADHPTGEGFDYIKGIRNNISKHWDYQPRSEDLSEAPYQRAVQAKPIPEFTVKIAALPEGAEMLAGGTDTVFVYVDPSLPPWLNPDNTITVKPFEPKSTQDAPLDSILLEIKNYIEYIHQQINQR
jgi:hypothetical protein